MDHKMKETTTKQLLTAKRVEEILVDCLFQEGEPFDNPVTAQGVMLNMGFHPSRLGDHKAEILDMLNELPDEFHDTKGGGMSFVNAGVTRDGIHWAEHETIDKLLTLGIATDQARILLPREMWHALPGGVPYVSITHKPTPDE